MKKLLLIILLIVGCEDKGTEPQIITICMVELNVENCAELVALYQTRLNARLEFDNQFNSGQEVNFSNYPVLKQAELDAFDAQKQAMYGLIGSGTVAGVVWLWNIIDVKKSKSKSYSDNNRFSMDINSHGQVEARISF